MSKFIYVPGESAIPLRLQSGKTAVAIRPVAKGGKHSEMLLDDGSFARLAGQRIEGVGVERFLKERGFIPAPAGNAQADRLADLINVQEGTTLVEEATMAHALVLQDRFSGQRCTFVPFDENAPIQPAVIAPPDGCRTVLLGIGSGLSCGVVKTSYRPDDPSLRTDDIHLDAGWLVGPNDDPAVMPRNTEYGGLVERAAFIIANTGLASVVPPGNLLMREDAPISDPMPRGRLELAMADSTDRIVVGINGVDELIVQYVRNGEVIAARQGLESAGGRLNLGSAVGSIAAVIVKVAGIDAAGTSRKKAA